MEHRLARLEENERRLRLALEAGSLGIWDIDLRDGAFYMDRRCRAIYGLSEHEVLSVFNADHARRLVHVDDWAQVEAAIVRAIDPTNPNDTFAVEHRLGALGQRPTWVAVCGEARFIGEGPGRRPFRIVGTSQDISARKANEQELERARELAESANQYKSEFIATISHELRTPMAALLGYAQLLTEQLERIRSTVPAIAESDCLLYAQTIRRSGGHLLEILNEILDLSKIEAGKLDIERQRVDLPRLLADVLALMAARAREKALTLRLEAEGPVPSEIRTSPKHLRQILINLISNAIKFTERGGVRVVCRLLAEAELLQIDVIDTGIGIGGEQQSSLFQPFVRADSQRESDYGTGLGLAISRRLARLLGGGIELESELGRGSRFTVTIATGPLAGIERIEPDRLDTRAVLPRPRADTPTPTLARRSELQVLLVEDSTDLASLYASFLSEHCRAVRIVGNGHEALRVAAEFSADVVLLDLGLPDMSGLELVRRLRRTPRLARARFIALTGRGENDIGGSWREAGFDEYLLKPVDLDRLAELIAGAGTQRK